MGSARGDISYTSAMLNNNPLKSTSGFAVTAFINIKAIPYKARLVALHEICLHIFHHLAQKLLDIRQYACIAFRQSDEKSDGASFAQALCDIALTVIQYRYQAETVRFQYSIFPYHHTTERYCP